MTQDLQPKTAPLPESQSDTSPLPCVDTPLHAVEAQSVEPAPKSAADAVSMAATGVDTGRTQALEIAELCQLAGQSTRIASFLAQGISPSQVRQALLLTRAQSEEISSLIHPDAIKPVANVASDASSALLAAVKKLSGTA